MNAKQRVRAAMRGEMPDRVPVFPVITDMHTTYMYDIPLWQTAAFPRLKYDLLEMAVREYGFDGFEAPPGIPYMQDRKLCVRVESGKRFLYEDGLKKAELSDDNYPILVDPPKQPLIEDVRQAESRKYQKIEAMRKSGYISEVARLVKRFGDDAYISSHAAGFTMNGLVNLRGSEQAMIDLYEEPELVHALFDNLCSEAVEIGKAIVDAGADCIYIGDAFSSCSLISPSQYKEFCLPYYKRFVQEMKPYGIDIYMHICGNSSPLFEMMAESGVNAIEPLDPLGGVTVADAKARVGKRVTLKGGVNTLTLVNGSVEEVVEETKKCLNEGMEGGRFLLGSGDDIPRFAKRENILAMVETVHKYGVYKKS